jgi:hypothetical protein
MDPLSALNAAAAIATALGLAFAVIQFRIAARQSVTDFEDTLATEYRTKELRRLIAEEYKSDPKDWGGDA